MISCGLDLGSSLVKGALVEDGKKLLATATHPVRGNLAEGGREVLEQMAGEENLLPGEIDYLCTTGFGRYMFPERQLQVSDFTSSAKGALFLYPATRHVLDVGAQSSRAMAVSLTGKVVKFKMNEKCAAGAGRFVERCSKYLQVPLEEMATRALAAEKPRLISSVCAVLAETEIINNVAEEIPLPDILMGVYLSLAQRAFGLMRYVGIDPEVTLVGGLVHSPAMVRAVQETTHLKVNAEPLGHHAAAIGAALLGYQRSLKLARERAGTGS
ncbi:MAG: acyl-CoA dehydratase activase [Thermoplasmata archaeon]|nr:acyl-CoA dehydratase activase [Thermoplasmata archaeon]